MQEIMFQTLHSDLFSSEIFSACLLACVLVAGAVADCLDDCGAKCGVEAAICADHPIIRFYGLKCDRYLQTCTNSCRDLLCRSKAVFDDACTKQATDCRKSDLGAAYCKVQSETCLDFAKVASSSQDMRGTLTTFFSTISSLVPRV